MQEGWNGTLPNCKEIQTKDLNVNPEENEVIPQSDESDSSQSGAPYYQGCDINTIFAIVFVRTALNLTQ